MGYDKRPGGFGGGDKGGFRGNRGGGFEKELFSATCATCQKECRVPFRPSGERPVYCTDCFRNVREDSGNDFSRPPRDFSKPKNDFAPRREFGSKPYAGSKPVIAGPDTRIGDLQKQVAALHVKVDSLVALLSARATPAPVVVEAPAKKVAPKKKSVRAKAK